METQSVFSMAPLLWSSRCGFLPGPGALTVSAHLCSALFASHTSISVLCGNVSPLVLCLPHGAPECLCSVSLMMHKGHSDFG